tara:strand:- start:486 stop:659 length:174 start_codon:yes stop_codon:yes gene_type:complete
MLSWIKSFFYEVPIEEKIKKIDYKLVKETKIIEKSQKQKRQLYGYRKQLKTILENKE